MEGILLVDKPKGPTSFEIVAQMRRLLQVKAIGHTGTLDPLASGLLLLLIGRYTRLCPYFTAESKSYVADIVFGSSTTTDDAQGEVVLKADPRHLTAEAIGCALTSFKGSIFQTPPLYSAISVQGVRAYKRARRGEDFSLVPREVSIYSISLLSYSSCTARIEVECSKGTYIRSLARDLGQALQVPAHLADLRRVKIGAYRIEEAIDLKELKDLSLLSEHIIFAPHAIKNMPTLSLDTQEAWRIKAGQRLPIDLAPSLQSAGMIFAYSQNDLVGIVRYKNGFLEAVRCFS